MLSSIVIKHTVLLLKKVNLHLMFVLHVWFGFQLLVFGFQLLCWSIIQLQTLEGLVTPLFSQQADRQSQVHSGALGVPNIVLVLLTLEHSQLSLDAKLFSLRSAPPHGLI